MKDEIIKELQRVRKSIAIIDIETSAVYPSTQKPIDIKSQFDDYIKYAKVKWLGIYSYKNDVCICEPVTEDNKDDIRQFLKGHKIIIGFNSENFDLPIMWENGLFDEDTYFTHIDLMRVLGTDIYKGFKNRAVFMGKNLRSNSLRAMAEAFDLETQKGDIDYKIFFNDYWTDEESSDIRKYLESDVMATKQLFDKLWDFWKPFTLFLPDESILRLQWITSSIASLTYTSACHVIGKDVTFGEKKEDSEREEMGGRAIIPTEEEVWDVWYLDEASKYPHTFAQFNLFNEVPEKIIKDMTEEQLQKEIDEGRIWHGNDMFKVRGYYYCENQGKLEKDVLKKIKQRFIIKSILKQYEKAQSDVVIDELVKEFIPDNINTDELIKLLDSVQYTIKIFLNSLYGAARSPIFEQLHTPNAGWDCCWIGQQIHEYVEKRFADEGYKAVGGFTDSWFFKAKDTDTEQHIRQLSKKIMDELKEHMPFPADSHQIAIETFMDYVMFHKDDKDNAYKKNNYCYIAHNKVKVVGFPVKKVNATKLGWKIFHDILIPKILKERKAKFDLSWVKSLVFDKISIENMAIKYDVKEADAYKPRIDKNNNEVPSSHIYAQISRVFFSGLGGRTYLVKNKKVGRIGSAVLKKQQKKPLTKNDWYYATLDECKNYNVKKEDLDTSKVYRELSPFVVGGKIE